MLVKQMNCDFPIIQLPVTKIVTIFIPLDILMKIFSHFSLLDLTNCKYSCKAFYLVTKRIHQNWPKSRQTFFIDFLSRNIFLWAMDAVLQDKLDKYKNQPIAFHSAGRFITDLIAHKLSKEKFQTLNELDPYCRCLEVTFIKQRIRNKIFDISGLEWTHLDPSDALLILLKNQKFEEAFAFAELCDQYDDELNQLAYDPLDLEYYNSNEEFANSQKVQEFLIFNMGHVKSLEFTMAFNDKKSQMYALTAFVILGCKQIEIPCQLTAEYLLELKNTAFIQSLNFFKTSILPDKAVVHLLDQLICPLLSLDIESFYQDKMHLEDKIIDENPVNYLLSILPENFCYKNEVDIIDYYSEKLGDIRKILVEEGAANLISLIDMMIPKAALRKAVITRIILEFSDKEICNSWSSIHQMEQHFDVQNMTHMGYKYTDHATEILLKALLKDNPKRFFTLIENPKEHLVSFPQALIDLFIKCPSWLNRIEFQTNEAALKTHISIINLLATSEDMHKTINEMIKSIIDKDYCTVEKFLELLYGEGPNMRILWPILYKIEKKHQIQKFNQKPCFTVKSRATEEFMTQLLKHDVNEFRNELERPSHKEFPKAVLNLFQQDPFWLNQFDFNKEEEECIYSSLFKHLDKYHELRWIKQLLIEAIRDTQLKAHIKKVRS